MSYKSWPLRALSAVPFAGNCPFREEQRLRCSVLLAGLLHNLDKIQLLPHSESPQSLVKEPLPDFAGRINPPPRRLLAWGSDFHISTDPMGKLLLCKINLNKNLPCAIFLHGTMCINRIYLTKMFLCSPSLCCVVISF